MTFLAGSLFGVVGSSLYQLVAIKDFRHIKEKWPWEDKRRGATIPFFLFTIFVRLIAAFVLVGFMTGTKQISGPWAAVIVGMVADVVVIKLANSAREEIT